MTEMSPAATIAAAGTTGFKAPGTTPDKTPRGYTPGLAAVNFGVYLALLTPVWCRWRSRSSTSPPRPKQATAHLGLVSGVGALFALIANPLAGRLSDRTTSRFGMRRPWILGGALVGARRVPAHRRRELGVGRPHRLVPRAGGAERRDRRGERDAARPDAGREPRQGLGHRRHHHAARRSSPAASSSTSSATTCSASSCPALIAAGLRRRLRRAAQGPPARAEARPALHDRAVLRLVRVQPAPSTPTSAGPG